MKKSFSFVLAALAVFFLVFTGCKIESSPSSKSVKKYNGTIYGKAFYSNTEDNSSIQITLDKTDGLRSAAVLESCGINDRSCYSIDGSSSDSRTVVSYTACDENGSYSFSNLEPGVYTVYALAKDSSERAVSRNISVVEDGKVLVPDLQLTATGSLSGKITVEGNESNNTGFVVFIAGTSYMAITGSNGSFTISDIPAGPGYEIVIMYGTYTYYWKNNVEVKPFVTTPVAEKVFTQDEYQTITNKQKGEDGKDGENGKDGEAGKDGTSIVWKGSFDSEDKLKNPQYLWAYFNTKDGCSYIYDGKEWSLLSYKGADGKDAAQYEIRTTDIPAGDSEYPAGAMKIEILKDGVVVETEYIEKTGQTFINYELNGGLFRNNPTVSMLYGNTIDLETPDKANYIFSGWYLDSNFSGEKISKIECNETNSKVTVYAKWIVGKQVYTIDELSVYLSSLSASNDPYNVLLNSETVDFEKLNTCLKNIKNGVEISFILPNGITTIPNGAFTNCIGLNSVTIPESVTFIGDSVFSGCRSLTSVNIPSGVKSIGDSVFENCSSLKTIDIPSSITSIGKNAFKDCSSLKTIDIPSNITSIGENAFKDCSSLTSIIIPSSITSLGDSVFENCSGLASIDIPTSITSIGENAFKGCIGFTSITIPSSITSIGDSVFENCSNLKTIDIPSSITSIGINAFKDCVSLPSITIPSSVISIGYSAFKGCSSLERVNITDLESWCKINFGDDTSNPLYYVKHLYIKDEEITSIQIPDTVTSIKNYAFENCISITSVTIPSSVTTIGDSAFSYCSSLSSINIPSSITFIGEKAFNSCGSLNSITIPESVYHIGESAFIDCTSLEKVNITDLESWCTITFDDSSSNPLSYAKHLYINDEEITSIQIPNTVPFIGKNAFKNCISITSVTIPSSVTAIGDSAFSYCSSLASVIIPSSVTYIGFYAFSYCINIRSVTIPSSVYYIGNGVFIGCENLEQINYIGTKEQWNSIVYDGIDFYDLTTTTINYFPNFNKDTYLQALSNSRSSYVSAYVDETSLPHLVEALKEYGKSGINLDLMSATDLETIPANTFLDCKNIKSVYLSSGVTSIGESAFEGCSNLYAVSIPSSVTSIGSEAFYGCPIDIIDITDLEAWCNISFGSNPFQFDKEKLLFLNGEEITSLVIPDGVASIDSYAFQGCIEITSVTIPSSVTSIGSYAFQYCGRLKSVIIPSSVTSIGTHAFYACSGLESITIPSSVTEIGRCAFAGCSGLTSVTIPSISIGDDIFGGCENLTKVTITHAVDGRIGNMGFDNLSDVIIADGVTSIGDYAFYGCSGLTSVTIPSSVTSIGSDAFRGCSGLTSVTIPSSVTTIASSAFSYCDNLTQITVDTNNPKYDSRNNCNAIIDTATNTLVIGCKDTIIPSSVTEIGDFAFEGCSGLESITIPSSLTTIGVGAFYDCIGLTSITIPDSVINIGDSAFYGCTNLEGLPFEDSETFYRLFYFDVIRRKD